MKIALYIEDGLEQIVLTPETDTEKSILGKLHDSSRALTIKRGTFYDCQGGWMRWARPGAFTTTFNDRDRDESTMIVLRREKIEVVSDDNDVSVEQIASMNDGYENGD